MYYDRNTNSWDDSACKYNHTTRCVKMDCHLSDTHFSLLGFFREPDYDEWMEQLFKHEGDCLWTDEEYGFMQGDRQAWPQGCQETIFTESGTGNTIRYALKPEKYGNMGIGLYTDEGCIQEYTGKLTTDEVLRAMVCGGYVHQYVDKGRDANNDDGQVNQDMCKTNNTDFLYYYNEVYANIDDAVDLGPWHLPNNVWSLDEYLSKWNKAFDVYKQCQPCKAYDLTNIVAGKGYQKNANGNRYNGNPGNHNGNQNGDDDYYKNKTFHCYDDAGYNDVNQVRILFVLHPLCCSLGSYSCFRFVFCIILQCMKFATHTTMMTATWQDVIMAGNQGTITKVQLPSRSSNRWNLMRSSSSSSSLASSSSSDNQAMGRDLEDRKRDKAASVASWIIIVISSALFGSSWYRLSVARGEASECTLKEPLAPKSHNILIA